jgi:N-acetylmuramic acid 6-phosphate etherase
MVNVQLSNEKLRVRGARILEQVLGVSPAVAEKALQAARERVPVAIIMNKAEVSRAQAERALRETGGHVRRAIAKAGASFGRSAFSQSSFRAK